MAKYKLTLIKDLANALRLSPLTQRELQISRLEHLIKDIEVGKKYPNNFVTYRLTLYNPPPNELMADGSDLHADLLGLLDEISGTMELQAKDSPDELLTLDQIKDSYDISAKTLAEWREQGLMTKRYVFADGIQCSAASRAHVESFVASLGQGPIYQIRTPNDKQAGLILAEAKSLATDANVSMPEAIQRISKKLDLPARLVRHAVRNYDLQHPEHTLFPQSSVPLDAVKRRTILAAHEAGQAEESLAAEIGVSRAQILKYLVAIRAEEILSTEIEYRYDPAFDDENPEEKIMNSAALVPPEVHPHKVPNSMPAYFADLSKIPVMGHDEEQALFRKYNYIKYRFFKMRESLKPSQGDSPELLAKLEELAKQAADARKRLVEANLRLVVKLARQHAGKIVGINDLISEGNLSLLKAIEKFDFTRGTRFSTYATWCVMKRFARVVPEENYLIETFATGSDEVIEIQPDKITSQLEQAENLAHLRAEIAKVLLQLDGRERDILSRRFGLAGQPQTLEEIGALLGITRERVRQIETRALKRAADLLKQTTN